MTSSDRAAVKMKDATRWRTTIEGEEDKEEQNREEKGERREAKEVVVVEGG